MSLRYQLTLKSYKDPNSIGVHKANGCFKVSVVAVKCSSEPNMTGQLLKKYGSLSEVMFSQYTILNLSCLTCVS